MVLQNKNNRSVLEKIDCHNRLGNKQMITIASDLTKYSKNFKTLYKQHRTHCSFCKQTSKHTQPGAKRGNHVVYF